MALPPAPRWRGPDSAPLALENASASNGSDGSNGSNGSNGAFHGGDSEAVDIDTTLLWP